MVRLLRAEGFQPSAYTSAEAFLADPERMGFDCLLLDVQLGGMSGLELQQQLISSGVRSAPRASPQPIASQKTKMCKASDIIRLVGGRKRHLL